MKTKKVSLEKKESKIEYYLTNETIEHWVREAISCKAISHGKKDLANEFKDLMVLLKSKHYPTLVFDWDGTLSRCLSRGCPPKANTYQHIAQYVKETISPAMIHFFAAYMKVGGKIAITTFHDGPTFNIRTNCLFGGEMVRVALAFAFTMALPKTESNPFSKIQVVAARWGYHRQSFDVVSLQEKKERYFKDWNTREVIELKRKSKYTHYCALKSFLCEKKEGKLVIHIDDDSVVCAHLREKAKLMKEITLRVIDYDPKTALCDIPKYMRGLSKKMFMCDEHFTPKVLLNHLHSLFPQKVKKN